MISCGEVSKLAPMRGHRLPPGVLVLLGRARSARWPPPEKQWNAAPRQDSIHTPSPARAVGSVDWPPRLLRQTRFRAAAWGAAPETGGMSATRCDDTLQLALVDLWIAGFGAKMRLLVDTVVWHTRARPCSDRRQDRSSDPCAAALQAAGAPDGSHWRHSIRAREIRGAACRYA